MSVEIKSTTTLSGGGELGALVRLHDWSRTELGPIESWSQSLKTSLSLILNSQHPMWIGWGAERTFLYNDAYIQILGPSKHPWALGRPFREVWAEIWEDVAPLADKVFDKGEATFSDNVRLFMRKPRESGDGFYLQEGYYSFSYSPIRDESGEVGGLFCPSADVTAKILSERRLRTLAELSANTLVEKKMAHACGSIIGTLAKNPDDVPFALLYLVDEQTSLATLVQSTGVPKGAEMFSPDAELFRNEKKSLIVLDGVEKMPRGLANQTVSRALAMPLSLAGQSHPHAVLVAGVNPARELDADYRTFFDLISRSSTAALQNAKAAEDERKRLEALAEIDRAKTAFFSNVSHEFRTPLTLMLGPLQDNLADSQVAVSSQYRQREELAYRNALRLLKLVNSLLDFSRIEAGRAKAHYRPTDLGKLTVSLSSMFRSAIEKAGLRLVVNVAEDQLPVYVDREMWEKIVLNLLSNAFKFTFHGEIIVSLTQHEGKARLKVRDTGTGVAAIEIPRLFERFHRIEGAKGRTHEGTGIGLALIQELVKLHGGKINVSSVLGDGTEFCVEIPLGFAHLPSDSVERGEDEVAPTRSLGNAFAEEALRWLPEAPSAPTVPRTSERRARILLADDNADMRGYVKGLLEGRWDVASVVDGEAAYEKAVQDPPDLILSDVMMPRVDGITLLQKLKTEPTTQRIPLILLSARAGEEYRVEGLRAGADDYLVKPFSAKELMARVETHLQIGRLRSEADEQRKKMYSVFMQAPVGICVLESPQHVFALANDFYYDILGGYREIIGKPIREALPELAEQGFYESLDQVYRTGETFAAKDAPLKLSLPNGESKDIFLNFTYQAMRHLDGSIDGILVVCNDVTEQVLARQRVEKLADELRRAVSARDEFLSIASHELKTPVTSLQMQLQLTRRSLKLETAPPVEKIAKAIDMSTRQVVRLTSLIEELLDVSRVEAGRMTYDFAVVDLQELVREVVDRFTEQLREEKCTMEILASGNVTLTCDRFRIEQVVTNLVTNAMKYGSGSPVRIDIAPRDAGHVVMAFSDKGMGIAEEKQSKVFERYERAISHNNISGLGLGLYIAKKIVEAHAGAIELVSELGKGSTFTVVLPVSQN